MKKINIKFLSLLALTAGLWASCADEVVVKDEADKSIFPTSAVSVSDMKLVENGNKSIIVSATVTNADTLNVLEYGFVYSTNEDMSNPSAVPVAVKEDGEMTAKISIAPSTTYYIAAYAYVRGAAVQTETISVTTNNPDPISVANLNGSTYYATGVPDAWDELWNIETTLVAGEGDSIFVCNLDPYFATNGLVASKGYNILGGVLTVSEDGSSATITCSPGQAVGYNDVVFYGYDMETGNILDIVIEIYNYGQSAALKNWTGTYSGGWWSMISPCALTLK
ncbi:MAG: hypothetical protein IKL03_04950 [Bacteroidaceae bacterium]|nr:hypothetical protein [Prevotella sp.]MBR3985239.1 hypothetical protein [Bacteroidaceae bacterium]MBR6629288.1 hypothetical protein [Bacteroidaceae bacterium]